jgi:hypothetical protein
MVILLQISIYAVFGGETYSPLIAGAISRSAQSGIGLGRPINEGRVPLVFSSVFSFFFHWFCWVIPPVFLGFTDQFFLNFYNLNFFKFELFKI